MSEFPRTTVGGVSLSRMIIGTNWFLGFSHTSVAKDEFIKEHMDRKRVADVMEVFVRAGVDTVMGLIQVPVLHEAVQEVQERTGRKMIVISTPILPFTPETPEKGLDVGWIEQTLDEQKSHGADFCFPHQATTDSLLDRCTRKIRHMDHALRLIRERGMIPGLGTHMPETIIFADESGLDVESYISLYNSMGFLMQLEVDWISRIIHEAKKPVMTIKPLAGGQLRPFQGLHFVWNTIRAQDMVTVGTMTPREAEECIEMSFSILEGRQSQVELQRTRSKKTLET